MSLNHTEIDLVLSELNLNGAFIQDVIQSDFTSLAFMLYNNAQEINRATTLYISLAAGACRLHETQQKIPKSEKPLRFMQLLKSRIKGGKIISVSQLSNDRIVKFKITRANETFFFFVRLWSGAANCILTDNTYTIIDVFYRRPQRQEITGSVFKEPETKIEQKKQFTVRVFPDDFLIRHFGEISEQNNPTFNQKIDFWYIEHGNLTSLQALQEKTKKIFGAKIEKMQQALSKLQQKQQTFLHNDQLKHYGDLILSFAYLFTPEQIAIWKKENTKTHFLACTDYHNNQLVKISIDYQLSAQENANRYYKEYKKATSGIVSLNEDIQKLEVEIGETQKTLAILLLEQNPIRLQQKLAKQSKPLQQIEKKHPGLSFIVNDWYILVGRSATENDELLRHHVKGNDLWLHARNISGGYIFIKYKKNKTYPLELLLNAGNLAVFYSKARKNTSADVQYTQVKYLRRAKNQPKGTVLPTNEKNISITLDEKRLKFMELNKNF